MLFTLACTHVLLASGAAYGWTALRPVLMDSGVFDSFPPLEQAAMLNSVATMGIAANALCKLPLGIFLDSLGPRYTAMVGAVLLSGGSLAMAIGDKQSQHIMMWSYFAIGVAGPFLQMPCFQFAELYGLKKESARATELAVQKFQAEVLSSQHREFDLLQAIKETENKINFLLVNHSIRI